MDGVLLHSRLVSGLEVTSIIKSYYQMHCKRTLIYNCNWIHLSAINGIPIIVEGLIVINSTMKDYRN